MNNNKKLMQIAGMGLVLIALIYISYAAFIKKADTKDIVADENQVMCAMDAKECPDGSFVGRTGPNCEFVCPVAPIQPDGTATTSSPRTPVSFDVKINQKVTPLSETVTVLSVVEDSRCPVDVQCIQAGTVRVQIKTGTAMGESVQTIKLGDTMTTETEAITFVSVLPEKRSTVQINPTDYKFTFKVVKR